MAAWCPFIVTLVVCCFTHVDGIPLFTSAQNWLGGSSLITDSSFTFHPSMVDVPETATSSVPALSSMQAYLTTFRSAPSAMNPSLPSSGITETVIDMSTNIIVLPTNTNLNTVVIIPTPSMPTAAPTTKTMWASPPQFTSLDDFNISAFGSGQHNLVVVKGIPAEASASIAVPIPTASAEFLPIWDNSTSVIQVFYPANSVDPANRPQGGADFYASPLEHFDMATNVSLGYSVFFPVDFDWVRGGKLPGLYGGHEGCSGGNNALTCFSTRLMWRADGAGELYLYAPKMRQTDSLCSDPLSVCDKTYGLSVGRGSFNFTPGTWTHVRQTVALNTPGRQDGGFRLEVNGQEVIDRTDILYRDVIPPSDGQGDHTASDNNYEGGLISHLLGNLIRRYETNGVHLWRNIGKVMFSPLATVVEDQWSVGLGPFTVSNVHVADVVVNDTSPPPIGFTGLFFSTFFGGHEPEYATPVDQYAWFKDFVLIVNT